MKTILTEVTVQTSAALVYKTLADLEGYHVWNNFMVQGTGPVVVGKKISMKLYNGKTITPNVLVADDGKELRWEGSILGNWFFGGEHYYKLEALGANSTKVIHGEDFYGIMVTLAPGFMKEIEKGYVVLNANLKKHCEALSSALAAI